MRCGICKNGETKPGVASFLFEKNNTTIVIKNVPAQVCEVCGEKYFTREVTKRLLAESEVKVANGVIMEITRYAA